MTKRSAQGRFSAEGCGLWTKEEHGRFMDALQVYPNGPWKLVAELVGTRSVRQTMTHAQKHRQKQARHARGLHLRVKASPDANSPDAHVDSQITAKKRSSKKVRKLSPPAPLETTSPVAPMLQSPYTSTQSHDDDAIFNAVDGAGSMMPMASHPSHPSPISHPPSITSPHNEPSASAVHALDELLCLVGSAQVVWSEASWFPSSDTNTFLDPMPFKPEMWTPSDDVGVYEFLAGSII